MMQCFFIGKYSLGIDIQGQAAIFKRDNRRIKHEIMIEEEKKNPSQALSDRA